MIDQSFPVFERSAAGARFGERLFLWLFRFAVVGVSMFGCALITSTFFSPENQRGPNSKKRVI